MQNEEWRRLARLAGYVYVPIGLLFILIFVLVEYQAMKVERIKSEVAQTSKVASATTTASEGSGE
ncbi:MAG: hypothetical protein A2Z88_05290 [Omnitrophica WOR_2 bacterium GWA2_47_8]|nr:MAG: hypothetical protein A2Z88_05290 [Omnitrophica WOR_2 bacterium GWA2_47_8]